LYTHKLKENLLWIEKIEKVWDKKKLSDMNNTSKLD
jgi:hypothetical protein